MSGEKDLFLDRQVTRARMFDVSVKESDMPDTKFEKRFSQVNGDEYFFASLQANDEIQLPGGFTRKCLKGWEFPVRSDGLTSSAFCVFHGYSCLRA